MPKQLVGGTKDSCGTSPVAGTSLHMPHAAVLDPVAWVHVPKRWGDLLPEPVRW